MPAERKRGMDHALYDFSALPVRRRLEWPGGARVALWICLHLEYWELDPPADAQHPAGIEGTWQIFAPDYRTFAHREYGNRIGVFRVLDALDAHGFPVTVAANAAVCRRYPALIRECVSRGWEIAAGGTHATRTITSRMSAADERAYIAESRTAVTECTQSAPGGWVGQDFSESYRTPYLVAEQGFRYIADWPNDEQPYWMGTTPRVVSVPQQTEWDDVTLLWLRQIATDRFPRIFGEALETLSRDPAGSGRTCVLNVHPWLFGQPHRIRYLRETLAAIAACEHVWRATALDIATHFAARAAEDGAT
jgi:allantoinase